MADIVALLWPLPNVSEGTGSRLRWQIEDINLWLQCFGTFITVMGNSQNTHPSCWHIWSQY